MTCPDGAYWTGVVSALASAVTAIAAVCAISFAKSQLLEARHATKVATVTSIYRSLLERALDYPDFVAPAPSDIDTKDETFQGDRSKFRRYESFVDLLLSTFEEMIKLPNDNVAARYIDGWLRDHQAYLLSDYFEKNFRSMVSDKLWERILSVDANKNDSGLSGTPAPAGRGTADE